MFQELRTASPETVSSIWLRIDTDIHEVVPKHAQELRRFLHIPISTESTEVRRLVITYQLILRECSTGSGLSENPPTRLGNPLVI